MSKNVKYGIISIIILIVLIIAVFFFSNFLNFGSRSVDEDEVENVASQIHPAFDNRDFDKMRDLVSDDIYFEKNGTVSNGEDKFINSLQTTLKTIPDVQNHDKNIYVDGNTAIVQYTVTGTPTKGLTFNDGTKLDPTNESFEYNTIEIMKINEQDEIYSIVQLNDSGLNDSSVEAQLS